MRGLYTAASGMLVQQLEMDRISNDLANAQTVGYRGQVAVYEGFPALLLHQIAGNGRPGPTRPMSTLGAALGWPGGQSTSMNGATPDEATWLRPRPVGGLEQGAALADQLLTDQLGAIRRTDNPLDVALADDSFLQVQPPAGSGLGVLLTRAGELQLNAAGQLVTASGQAVLVQQPGGGVGPLTVPSTPQIDEDGRLWVSGQMVGRLARVRVVNPSALQPVGNGPYFRPTAVSGGPVAVPLGAGGVQPGAVEMPAVEPVMSMVQMITANRAYEAAARLVTTYDETYGKLIQAVMA